MSGIPLPPQDTSNYSDTMAYADKLKEHLTSLHLNILSSISGRGPGVTDAELNTYRNLSDTLISTLRSFNKTEAVSREVSERLELAERALGWNPAFAINVVTSDTGSGVEPLGGSSDSDKSRLRRILEQGSQRLPIQNEIDHWICRNAFEVRRQLASDDVERRQLDLALVNTLVHGASVITNSNPDLVVAWLEEAAGLAKDRLGDSERSAELLRAARIARTQLGPGLPNAANLKAELEQVLIRGLQRQHSERFLPPVDELVAYHSAPVTGDDTYLDRLLRDSRLVVDVQEVERRKAQFANNGLVSYLQSSHRDSQGNFRGWEDPKEGLRFFGQNTFEIVEAIGAIWWALEKLGFLNEAVVADYLQMVLPHFNWSLAKRGLERHFVADFVSSIHILAPQVESLIAWMANAAGIVTIRLDDQKRQEVLALPSLLAPGQTRIRDMLSPELFWVARLFLVESRSGLNIRNKVAHGLITPEECNATISANLVFLVAHIARRLVPGTDDGKNESGASPQ